MASKAVPRTPNKGITTLNITASLMKLASSRTMTDAVTPRSPTTQQRYNTHPQAQTQTEPDAVRQRIAEQALRLLRVPELPLEMQRTYWPNTPYHAASCDRSTQTPLWPPVGFVPNHYVHQCRRCQFMFVCPLNSSGTCYLALIDNSLAFWCSQLCQSITMGQYRDYIAQQTTAG